MLFYVLPAYNFHKKTLIFAVLDLLNMRIIKLNAIDSTNSYLRSLSISEKLTDCTIVTAKEQTNGRGQMGTSWNSDYSKNLTVSVYFDVSPLKIDQNFYISMAASLAVLKTVKDFNIKNSHVKWPNDILADSLKIAGILIENIIKKKCIEATIIGIGLNVNQTHFEDLPKASSLKKITGVKYNLDEVLFVIVKHLEDQINRLKNGEFEGLKNDYESKLFRIDKPSTFENNHGKRFTGFIKGVNKFGKLKVLLEDEKLEEFDLKEIKLLY